MSGLSPDTNRGNLQLNIHTHLWLLASLRGRVLNELQCIEMTNTMLIRVMLGYLSYCKFTYTGTCTLVQRIMIDLIMIIKYYNGIFHTLLPSW